MARIPILDRVPVRHREFEVEDDLVIVQVPRFDGRIGAWLVRRLRRPNYRVRLDRFGTDVWRLCDGARTVREIAQVLRGKHGEEIEPAEERVAGFLQRMDRARCLLLPDKRSDT